MATRSLRAPPSRPAQARLRRPTIPLLVAALVALAGCSAPTPDEGTPGPSTSGTAPAASPAATTPSTTATSTTATSPASARPSTSTEPPATTASSRIALTVTIKARPEAPPVTYSLRCVEGQATESSTVPQPQQACSLLSGSAADALLSPGRDAGQACTQQYGGPATATITGTVGGRHVDARFARTNGCEISTWDMLTPLLGTPGAA